MKTVDEILIYLHGINEEAFVEAHWDAKDHVFRANVSPYPPYAVWGTGNTAGSAIQNAFGTWEAMGSVEAMVS